MNINRTKISQMGFFVALGLSLGFLLLYIPNVEMITAIVFISGYLMGMKEGIIVGFLTETLYSLFNPLCAAAPPLLAAQVISMCFTGYLGGILGSRIQSINKFNYIHLGLAGFLSTAVCAILTTLSFLLLIGLSFRELIGSFIYGLGFYAMHLFSNTLIFITIVPLLLNVASRTGWFIYRSVGEITS